VPKAKGKPLQAMAATLVEVVDRLDEAFDKVEANRGAPGPDGNSVLHVRMHWSRIRSALADSLLGGGYRPGDIRRVWIPKPGGGDRGLGIPNVIDRVVQEAVRVVLEPHYDPTFHPSSHGFRPNRSCHTAIAEASSYIEEGCTWVVDIDLEQFFDRVCHQRLMARLSTRVEDKRLLTLIGHMLKAKVVLPDGVRVSNEEGVPQGGPLSPLLSNIVLSELDDELARRGLRFVRYADDCNIYVRSERAGKRVMESVTRFIERRLRLTVNAKKSAVARPETRHFLGFRLEPSALGPPKIHLSERSIARLREKVRELTPRNRGASLQAIITTVNRYLLGWDGFFRICTPDVERVLGYTDAHIRRRLRAIVLKHWKTKRTIARRLIRLGVNRRTAWRRVYAGRKSLWNLSHDPAVDRGLRNAYFAKRGLVSLLVRARERWQATVAPGQLLLPWDTSRS
jgi:group II intron reverse transcriptase/maturase